MPIRRMPPIANAALAYAVGTALAYPGTLLAMVPLVIAGALMVPIRASWRLKPTALLWFLIALAGTASGFWGQGRLSCPLEASRIEGRVLATAPDGAMRLVEVGRPRIALESDRVTPEPAEVGSCETRVFFSSTGSHGLSRLDLEPGARVELGGEWREGRARPWFRARTVERSDAKEGDQDFRWKLVRWRATLIERIHVLFGERGGLVAGLLLAERDGIDPDLKRAFSDTGTAHLLAISGFHVGVVYGLCLVLARLLALSRRGAALAASLATWSYVAFIGFPEAASRAATIVAVLALARLLGRPQARWGGLGAAALILLALEPSGLESVGFQLSFAGAGGLVAWSRPVEHTMLGFLAKYTARRPPRFLTSAVASGVAATAATLPIVIWHFEQVAIIGIPATLAVSPLVALAVPGAIMSLGLHLLSPDLASVFAGGVELTLYAAELVVNGGASLSWASVWVPNSSLAIVATGVAIGAVLVRVLKARLRHRRAIIGAWAVIAVVAWPLMLSLSGRNTVRVHFLDVGQGDAIAIRTPRDRWFLIDTGPPSRGEGGVHTVVRDLRRLGVRRIEALVLTHPDLDHIGGAVEVLGTFDVGVVLDPAMPSGREAYLDVLAEASVRGVEWRRAVNGERWTADGVTFTVLAPGEEILSTDTEANTSSVVLLASFGDFDLLLTGDAPREVERAVLSDIQQLTSSLEVLKVGHHGSSTSTDPALLDGLAPEVAVISLGRYNRYGHPDEAVVSRLESRDVTVYRTDQHGALTVLARANGLYLVSVDS